MSQVKFYKGMSNSLASEGKKLDGTAVNDGGILFTSESNNSGRIYTRELGEDANNKPNVTEYYKEDLEFASNLTTNKTLGTLAAGTSIGGKRIIEVLKELLFATYAPQYKAPEITQQSYSTTPSTIPAYKKVGESLTVTADLTITATPASANSYTNGNVTGTESAINTANGGDLNKLVVGGKDFTLNTSDTSQKITRVNQTNNYNLPLVSQTFTKSGVGSVSKTFYNITSATFSVGNSSVKDSQEHLTNKYSTNSNTELANANTEVVSNNTFSNKLVGTTNEGGEVTSSKINETTITVDITKSAEIKFYAPIYFPSNVLNLSGFTGTPSNPASLSIANTTINSLSVSESVVSNGLDLGGQLSYNAEKTNGEQWVKMTFPQVNYGTNDFKILVPNGTSIGNLVYSINSAGNGFGDLGAASNLKFTKTDTSVTLHGLTYYYWILSNGSTEVLASSILGLKFYKS